MAGVTEKVRRAEEAWTWGDETLKSKDLET